ncbi:hypothetical protein C6Q07_13500, partial [Burkholderia multivorans]
MPRDTEKSFARRPRICQPSFRPCPRFDIARYLYCPRETLINGPTSEVAGEMASNFLDDEAN